MMICLTYSRITSLRQYSPDSIVVARKCSLRMSAVIAPSIWSVPDVGVPLPAGLEPQTPTARSQPACLTDKRVEPQRAAGAEVFLDLQVELDILRVIEDFPTESPAPGHQCSQGPLPRSHLRPNSPKCTMEYIFDGHDQGRETAKRGSQREGIRDCTDAERQGACCRRLPWVHLGRHRYLPERSMH